MAETSGGIGASVRRHEDTRHLFGEGEFVADLRLPGTRDVAFVRSPHAHARVHGIAKPAGREGEVFTAPDRAVTGGGPKTIGTRGCFGYNSAVDLHQSSDSETTPWPL